MKTTTAEIPSPNSPRPPSGTEELLRAGKALGGAVTPPDPYAPYAIVPEGYDLIPIPRQQLPPLPDHIRQTVRLDDAASFVTYVKAFRTRTTRVFAASVNLSQLSPGHSGGAKFTALLDYHDEAMPGRVGHVAEYPVPLSPEFSAWLTGNGRAMSQLEFVSFIEANCVDVMAPDSASLMELALNFESRTTAQFQSKVDRVTGGRALTFQEQVDAGAPSVSQMKVPEWLTLRIRVFEGGEESYELRARVEYRAQGGRLTITFHMQRPHDVFRAALVELRQEIAAALETEILTGGIHS